MYLFIYVYIHIYIFMYIYMLLLLLLRFTTSFLQQQFTTTTFKNNKIIKFNLNFFIQRIKKDLLLFIMMLKKRY